MSKNNISEDSKNIKLMGVKRLLSAYANSSWFWAAVASTIAIVLLIINLNQRKALSDCASENSKLIENQKIANYKLEILRHPDTRPIDMKGLDIAPSSKVLVYWNPKAKATLLSIQNLDLSLYMFYLGYSLSIDILII